MKRNKNRNHIQGVGAKRSGFFRKIQVVRQAQYHAPNPSCFIFKMISWAGLLKEAGTNKEGFPLSHSHSHSHSQHRYLRFSLLCLILSPNSLSNLFLSSLSFPILFSLLSHPHSSFSIQQQTTTIQQNSSTSTHNNTPTIAAQQRCNNSKQKQQPTE